MSMCILLLYFRLLKMLFLLCMYIFTHHWSRSNSWKLCAEWLFFLFLSYFCCNSSKKSNTNTHRKHNSSISEASSPIYWETNKQTASEPIQIKRTRTNSYVWSFFSHISFLLFIFLVHKFCAKHSNPFIYFLYMFMQFSFGDGFVVSLLHLWQVFFFFFRWGYLCPFNIAYLYR